MPRRSRAREVVLQVLYRIDVNRENDSEQRNVDYDDRFLRQRLHSNQELVKFASGLVEGVLQFQEALDARLTAHANNWSLRRMPVTDRNVLRLGAFELLHTDVPRQVVINEAVELARRFGSVQSPNFVNGVLDALRPQPTAATSPKSVALPSSSNEPTIG